VPILQINGETLQLNGEDLYLNGIDGAPSVVSVAVSDALITQADVGGTFAVAVTFSEVMDTASTPAITFSPDVSSTLTFSSGAWSVGDTVYTASYSIADNDIEVSGVEIDVTGGVGIDANPQDNYTPGSQFSIDTYEPTPTPEPEPTPGSGGGGGGGTTWELPQRKKKKRAAPKVHANIILDDGLRSAYERMERQAAPVAAVAPVIAAAIEPEPEAPKPIKLSRAALAKIAQEMAIDPIEEDDEEVIYILAEIARHADL
jgi:hypothetical protein